MNLDGMLILILFYVLSTSAAISQVRVPQFHLEITRPIKLSIIRHRPEFKFAETIRSPLLVNPPNQKVKQNDRTQITFNHSSIRHENIEKFASLISKIATAISKPETIVNLIRFFALVVSTEIISLLLLPLGGILDVSRRKTRERTIGKKVIRRGKFMTNVNLSDIELAIDRLIMHHEEMKRRKLATKNSCFEHSLCLLGDMISFDFPHLVISTRRLMKNHNPSRPDNKYRIAISNGLERKNCSEIYKVDKQECVSVIDHMRDYIDRGIRLRRDRLSNSRDGGKFGS